MTKDKFIGLYGRGTKVSIKDRNVHEGEVDSIYYRETSDDYIVGVKCNKNSNYIGEIMPVKLDSVKLILRPFEELTNDETKIWDELSAADAVEYLIDIGVDAFDKHRQGWVIYPSELKRKLEPYKQINLEDFRNEDGRIYLKPSKDKLYFEPSSEITKFILIEKPEDKDSNTLVVPIENLKI